MSRIKDSGNRTEYSTGAVRDARVGKGRVDLMPLSVVNKVLNKATDDAKYFGFKDCDFTISEAREKLKHDLTMSCLESFIYGGDTDNLVMAIYYTIVFNDIYIAEYLSSAKEMEVKVTNNDIPVKQLIADTMRVCSIHFENGTLKYGERNWEKGIDLHAFIDSAGRHYLKLVAGFDDEPHHLATIWNMMCAVWTHKNLPQMNDLPCKK